MLKRGMVGVVWSAFGGRSLSPLGVLMVVMVVVGAMFLCLLTLA